LTSEASEPHPERGGTEGGGTEDSGGRRAWPWVLGAVLLLVFLVVGIVVLAIAVGVSGGSGGGGSAERASWEESYVTGEGEAKIAALPISGTITESTDGGVFSTGGATPGALRSQLQQAEDDSEVEAVILEVNSPGGGVVPSDEMYRLVRDFKREAEKPVVVSMGSTAASGGYYISAAADTIVANPSTITGSIGVIFNYTNFSEALDKVGVNPEPITSGEFKDLASPADELSEAEREIIESQIQDNYDQFVAAIVDGRPLSEERVRELGDGRTYSGEQAAANGLVDELGGIEQAAVEARELANVERAEVVRYEESPGLLEAIQARIAPQEPEVVQIIEAAGVEPTPEFQYLYRPGL
jgi:protease IV